MNQINEQERLRLEQIKTRKRREEFCQGMDNLYTKFRNLDYYHVPKYAR